MALCNTLFVFTGEGGCVMGICRHFVRCSCHMATLLNLAFGERCIGCMELAVWV